MIDRPGRRRFMQYAGMGAVAYAAKNGSRSCIADPFSSAAGARKFELGIASYTFREFPTEQALAMTKRLGLRKIAFKDFHLKLDATLAQIEATLAKVKAAGLELYGGGVIYMESEAEVNRAFDYAKAAGMGTIIGVPNHDLLGLVDKKVREFNIRVAIHNHGPGDDVYPTPQSVYDRISTLDRRIGLCIDVGHTQRSGIDPSEAALKYGDRLIDIHMKDVSAPSASGETVEVGRGVINVPKFLRTLQRVDFEETVALEYEKDEKDPLPGSAESIGYLRGVLATM